MNEENEKDKYSLSVQNKFRKSKNSRKNEMSKNKFSAF